MMHDAHAKNLIENSSVPDLERLAMQEMLNAMTARGELSGPPLKEDGKDSDLFQARLRERDARLTIMGSVLSPARPRSVAEFGDRRQEDLTVLDAARGELSFIPDATYQGHHPRAACVAKVQALEAAFRQKWELGAATIEAVTDLLSAPPAPGELVESTGRFDTKALQRQIALIERACELIDQLPEEDRDRSELEERIRTYQAAVIAGISAGPSNAIVAPDALRVSKRDTAVIAARPAERVASTGGETSLPQPVSPPLDPEQVEFDAWCEEMRRLPVSQLPVELGRLETEVAPTDTRKIGFVAGLLAMNDLAVLTPEFVLKIDDAGLIALAEPAQQARIRSIGSAVRMAIVKSLVAADDLRVQARAIFAGALGADLVRQHPKALGELLNNAPGPHRAGLICYFVRNLKDEEILALGRENVHAVYKGIGAPTTDEARRQAARLGRLTQRR